MKKLKICYLHKKRDLGELLRPIIQKYGEIVYESETGFPEDAKPGDWDLTIMSIWTQILKPEHLNIPTIGTIHTHQGKLPEYRGASVINWQIINNEPKIHVSITETKEKLDSGKILAEGSVDGSPPRTIKEIRSETNKLLVNMMDEVLRKISEAESINFGKEQEGAVKIWKSRKPEDSELNINLEEEKAYHIIRSCEEDYPPFVKIIGKKYVLLSEEDYQKLRKKI